MKIQTVVFVCWIALATVFSFPFGKSAQAASTCADVVATVDSSLQSSCVAPEACGGAVGTVMPANGDCEKGKICCGRTKEQAAAAASAGGSAAETPKTLEELDPLGKMVAYDVIQNIIRAFLGFVGALALLVFVYAGITWMTAESSDRVQKAKDTMKYAVIGLSLVIFSYAITTFFIKTVTGG